jgi:hypothetical protein
VERPLIDYEKSMKDVRLKLNSMYGTLASSFERDGHRQHRKQDEESRKRVDDMFISNNAKIAAIDVRRCLNWTVSNSTLLEDARMRRRWK